MAAESRDRTTPLCDQYDALENAPDLDTIDRRASDDSPEPRPEIADCPPGTPIRIGNADGRITSVRERVNFNQRGRYSLTLSTDTFGTVATLFVDRDPYELEICNGPTLYVDPDAVAVLDEDQDEVEEATATVADE